MEYSKILTKVFIVFLVIDFASNENNETYIANSKFNLFRNANSFLDDAISDLFTSLQFNISSPIKNIYKSLVKHKEINAIAEKYSEIYNDIEKVIKPELNNKTIGNLKFIDTIEEIYHELFRSRDIYKNSSRRDFSNLLKESSESLEFDDEFIKEFLNKIEKSARALLSESLLTSKRYLRVKKKYRLKEWRPRWAVDGRRLYQGRRVKVKSFPFMASIHLNGEFRCAGAVISSVHVITAATCLIIVKTNNILEINPSGLKARIGSDYTTRSGRVVIIKEIFLHPAFDPVHYSNNLAIARLNTRLEFGKGDTVIRIRVGSFMPTASSNEILMLGWGDKAGNKSGVYEPLHSSYINIYDRQKCENIYTKTYVDDKNFCVLNDGGGGACKRDLGGPGIYNRLLVGVVSFGPQQCGDPETPTVFVSLGFYLDWIDQVVNKPGIIKQYKQLTPKIPTTTTTRETYITTHKLFKRPKLRNKRKKQRPEILSHVNSKDSEPSQKTNAPISKEHLLSEETKSAATTYLTTDTFIEGFSRKHQHVIRSSESEVSDSVKQKPLPVNSELEGSFSDDIEVMKNILGRLFQYVDVDPIVKNAISEVKGKTTKARGSKRNLRNRSKYVMTEQSSLPTTNRMERGIDLTTGIHSQKMQKSALRIGNIGEASLEVTEDSNENGLCIEAVTKRNRAEAEKFDPKDNIFDMTDVYTDHYSDEDYKDDSSDLVTDDLQKVKFLKSDKLAMLKLINDHNPDIVKRSHGDQQTTQSNPKPSYKYGPKYYHETDSSEFSDAYAYLIPDEAILKKLYELY